jgi:Na+/phosphate symporter
VTSDAPHSRATAALQRVLLVAAGLLVFVLALELLKKGAAGIAPLLQAFHVSGIAGGVGFGWLMACIVLSGSPVAAIALTLMAAGTLGRDETFAMICGSRLGASFVVLVIGLLDDLRHSRREKKSAYVGVAALVVTAIVYLPATALGYLGLQHGLFEGLRIPGAAVASLIDTLVGPLVRWLVALLPRFVLFVGGVLMLLGAFKLFDRVLPDLQAHGGPPALAGRVTYRPWVMFAFGLGITAITLSVSVSISILVPLTAKGYVRRENLFPYILGANITTFIDTLFAGALVGHSDAVRLVATLMTCVTALSVPIVFLFPYAFERFVDRIARLATADSRALLVFVCCLLAIPVALIALRLP